jgi:hypothetical protein
MAVYPSFSGDSLEASLKRTDHHHSWALMDRVHTLLVTSAVITHMVVEVVIIGVTGKVDIMMEFDTENKYQCSMQYLSNLEQIINKSHYHSVVRL